MDTLRKLKSRLENVGNNDVHATITRILDAKTKAQEAKEAAENARDRALDLLAEVNKIDIPNLQFAFGKTQLDRADDGDQTVEQAARKIEDEANKLQHNIEVLLNEFTDTRGKLENRFEF